MRYKSRQGCHRTNLDLPRELWSQLPSRVTSRKFPWEENRQPQVSTKASTCQCKMKLVPVSTFSAARGARGGRREEPKPLGANIQKAATRPFPQWRLHQNGEEDALGKILIYDCYKGMDILTTDRLFSVLKRNRDLLVFLLLATEEVNRTVQNFNQGGSA